MLKRETKYTSSIAILSEHPELAHVFLYEADRGFLFRSQPQRMNDPYFLEEHQRLEKTFRGWFTFEAKTMLEALHKRTRRIAWYRRARKAGRRLRVHDDGLLSVAAASQKIGL